MLDAHGIDAFCSVGGGYLHAGRDYHLGNDFLLAVWRRMPDRMIPFMGINPNDTPSHIQDELSGLR